MTKDDFVIKVKPCPFCGSPQEKKVGIAHDKAVFYIYCPECKCRMSGKETIYNGYTMEQVMIAMAEVITRWNGRK